MFTGIVTEVGSVASMVDTDGVISLSVTAPDTRVGLQIGDSIAVNGVCLTAVELSDRGFRVEAVDETMQRTALGDLVAGSPVNLERPLPADGRFDGHIVQGHVDGVGSIVSITPEGGSVRVRIAVPVELAPYIVEKGSIGVDGTSLTVTSASQMDADEAWLEVVLIPHTLDVTVFGTRDTGDRVNLEVDVVAKYVERMMGGRT